MSSQIKVTLSVDQFKKPFEYGWRREIVENNLNKNREVYYISPAGIRLRTKKEILLHLEDGLDINMFTLAKQPLGIDEEIVRIASERGYKKSMNTIDSNFPVLGELTNNTVEDVIIDDCSNSIGNIKRINLNRSKS